MDVNSSSCTKKSHNVNVGRCIKDFGTIVGIIGVVPGTVLNAAARATLKTYLTDLSTNDNPSLRSYALHGIVGWEEANGEAKTETLPNGLTKYLEDGKPVYTARFDGGGFNMHKILRAFKNAHMYCEFFLIHEGNTIGGKQVRNADGSYDLQGLSFFQIWAMSRTFKTPSAAEKYGLYLVLNDTKQINEDYGYVEADFDVKDATKGLVDVRLEATNVSATKYNVKVLASYASMDLSAYYPGELDDPAAWIVKDIDAGTTLTISGVVAKVGYFELTASASITSGNKISFQLASPSALKALGVVGFESEVLIVEMP